jgi:hypothetical protein
MASRVAASSLVSWTLALAMAAPHGPPLLSTTRLRFTPFFPRSVGLRPTRSPQNGPCPSPRRLTATASRPPQVVAGVDKNGPHPLEDPQVAPVLEVPVHGAVVANVLGEVIPLAACAQAEDHPIEHWPQIGAAMPLGLGGIELGEDRFDSCPYVVRNFPDRWLRVRVHDNPLWLLNTGELSSGRAC